jgi:hypothetical protein
VVHRFAALLGRFYRDRQLFPHARLAGKIIQRSGTQRRFKLAFFFNRRRGNRPIRGHANFTLAHGC